LKASLLQLKQSGGGLSSQEAVGFEHSLDRLNERLLSALEPQPVTYPWNGGNWHHGWKGKKQNIVSSNPPKWSIRREGGYYDGTGQVQGNVPGNELYRYGGTMSDGRPAPTTPNVHVNTSGHIIW